MRRRLLRVICLGIVIASMTFIGKGVANVEAAKVPALQVKGTTIVDKSGKTVVLKGVSTHGIAWFPQYVNRSAFKSFKKMGANTIRLALYSESSCGYSRSWYSTIDKGVKAATKEGMYVIIDWHILGDGNPKTNQKEATVFFKRMSKKYKKYTNVIYEICNEPNGNVTWEKDIKPYAESMIKTIRKQDKDAIIIVGTPTWSQDVDVVAQSPITGQKNIMYALHFYAATHKDWNRTKVTTALSKGLPIIVSEFSICDASGNGGLDKVEAAKWMSLLRNNNIGYIAWSLSNKAESASLLKPSCTKTGGFKKGDLSDSAKWIAAQWKK